MVIWDKAPRWLWLALALAMLARLAVAWSPLDMSFSLSVPDDSYYYFTIARNIALGDGPTFDGLAPTNGFHPLWMALITPFWLASGGSVDLPVHLVLTLGAVLDTLTMVGIFRLACGLTNSPPIAGLTAIAYAWNPYNLAASVNGLETSLSTMLFVCSVWSYWRLRDTRESNWHNWLRTGLLWGLLILARTDYAVILLPCGLDLLWQRQDQIKYALVAATGSLLWIPWGVWNVVTFGHVTQVSGKAYPYYLHAIWRAGGHSLGEWLIREAQMAYGIAANSARLSGFDKGIMVLLLFAAYLVVLSLFAEKPSNWAAPSPRAVSKLLWPTSGAIVLLSVHGLVRWMYLPWYFVPSTILLILWFALMLTQLAGSCAPLAVMLGLLYLGFQLFSGFRLWQRGGMWPDQARVAEARMTDLRLACEQFDTLGISDAGYYGYHLPCRVVNLDGVVNNRAYNAIRHGEFRAYLHEVGIDYVSLNTIVHRVVQIQKGSMPSSGPFVIDGS